MVEGRSLWAVVGGLGAFLTLAGQVIATALRPPSPLETVLFAALQTGFVAFAVYVLAQETSGRGFLQQQKRVGYGALRRIREVADTLGRLQDVVRQKRDLLARNGRLDPALTGEYLEHILSVAEELKGKVLASREDWQEVFASELRQLREIEELSRRRRAEPDEARRHHLDLRIEALKAGMPVTAQALASDFGELVAPVLVAPGRAERPPAPAIPAGVAPSGGRPGGGRPDPKRVRVGVPIAGKKGKATGNGAPSAPPPGEPAPVA